MDRKEKSKWDGKERRVAERRIAERRRFGRELTNAEREAGWDGDDRRLGDRRIVERRRYGRELTNAERDREDLHVEPRRPLLDQRLSDLQEARKR